MGSRPGGRVLRVHRAPHPGALNSQLCPWCRLRSSAQRSRASRSTSRASACSTAFQHTTPWPSAQHKQGKRPRGGSGTWGNILELAFCFLPLNLMTRRGGAGPEAPSRHPPSAIVLHVSPPLGMAGALGLSAARTVCGPRTLLRPVRPRSFQTHVQKIFHRSDRRHRPSSHVVPSCVS